MRQKGFSLLELTIVTCIIAILAALFLHRANEVVDAAHRAALKSLARSFASAMANLRGKWIVEGGRPGNKQRGREFVLLDNQRIYVNEFGWPANTNADDALNSSQTPEECRQLWNVISQNPVSATTDEQQRGTTPFHISTREHHICRFELAYPASGTHYFDYDLKTGRVETHIPPIK